MRMVRQFPGFAVSASVDAAREHGDGSAINEEHGRCGDESDFGFGPGHKGKG
jgi:hypothetical protein